MLHNLFSHAENWAKPHFQSTLPPAPNGEPGQFYVQGYQPGQGYQQGRWDLTKDANDVFAAMKGIGTKEKALIAVFCNRPKGYLQDLRHKYHEIHHLGDLLRRVRAETSGQHQRMFEALLETGPEQRAHYIHNAVKGVGTNEMLLIDCALTTSNWEMSETKRAYQHHNLVPLAMRVDFDTSGSFQKLLDVAIAGKRPEDGVQQHLVDNDLQILFNATEGKKFGCDARSLIELVSMRSKSHLMHLNVAYKGKSPHGRTFVEEITIKEHGYTEKAFVSYFLGPASWHAFRINMELKGHIGADWDGLLRSIFIPSMDEIKTACRILREVYHEDLQAKISHLFFHSELKLALEEYLKFAIAEGVDSKEVHPAGNSGPAPVWQDPQVPPPNEHHALHLSQGQKIGLGVGAGILGLGIAAAVGVGIYEHEKHKGGH